jgi:hypothetical protein
LSIVEAPAGGNDPPAQLIQGLPTYTLRDDKKKLKNLPNYIAIYMPKNTKHKIFNLEHNLFSKLSWNELACLIFAQTVQYFSFL